MLRLEIAENALPQMATCKDDHHCVQSNSSLLDFYILKNLGIFYTKTNARNRLGNPSQKIWHAFQQLKCYLLYKVLFH